MEIGVDSFAMNIEDPSTGLALSGANRMENLLAEIVTADRVGVDVFGVGEHHREEFLDAAPAVILAAAAARTSRIRLSSAVTVLSAADPVRVFQEFATADLISRGRIEMVVGRGSSTEAFPLFGYRLDDYDSLFAEKLELLLQLQKQTHVQWQGRFRPALSGQGVFPRPHQNKLPIWLGVGGTPQSFARAGHLGMPLMVAIVGGSFDRFRPLIDLYREAGRQAGHAPADLKVGVHAIGFVGETDEAARTTFFPGWFHLISRVAVERGWAPPSLAQFDAMCGPSGAFLIGSVDTVTRKAIEADRILGGLSRITFQMSTAMQKVEAMQRSIELLGLEVAPRIRSARQVS